MAVLAKVDFTCPQCRGASRTTLEVPEISWASSDRLSDLVSEDQVVVQCTACRATFDAHVQNSLALCTVILDEYPDTPVSAVASLTPTKNDEWLNTDIPPDPHSVFMDSYYHVGDILAEYGKGGRGILSHSAYLIHRMVFVQQISALEAYLGDTLVKQVLSRPSALHALLVGDNELKELKIPLLAIAKDPEIVKVVVRKHLQSILYHNLAKVAVLYKLALQVDIWPDKQTKEDLFDAVSLRHDYVHRNGRNKDGDELPTLMRDYVASSIDSMLRLVNYIESQIAVPNPGDLGGPTN